MLTPQHPLSQSKTEVVPTHHFWPGPIHMLIDIPNKNGQVAGLQSGHGLRIVRTIKMGSSEQMWQGRGVDDCSLSED